MNPEKRAMLPNVAFTSYGSRFRAPTIDEGFQDILKIDFLVSVALSQALPYNLARDSMMCAHVSFRARSLQATRNSARCGASTGSEHTASTLSAVAFNSSTHNVVEVMRPCQSWRKVFFICEIPLGH